VGTHLLRCVIVANDADTVIAASRPGFLDPDAAIAV